MSKTSATRRAGTTTRFLLNMDRGEKITAVEGLRLTERMRHLVLDPRTETLTSEERRAIVKDALDQR